MMNAFLIAAVLSGPVTPEPRLTATVITDDWDTPSRVLKSEWDREWRLWTLRAEIEASYRIHFVRSTDVGHALPFLPAVYVGSDGPYRVSCGGSGDALHSLHGTLMHWKGMLFAEDEDAQGEWERSEWLRTGAWLKQAEQ